MDPNTNPAITGRRRISRMFSIVKKSNKKYFEDAVYQKYQWLSLVRLGTSLKKSARKVCWDIL